MSLAVRPAREVSVLFARGDSYYFQRSQDVWHEARDARLYKGWNAVIAHPPCRGWGRLSKNSVATAEEKAMGIFAAGEVRRCGGVLEHPWASKLWAAAGLPKPVNCLDEWGGFTILVDQGWWGHAAPKPTWLYICGLGKKALPPMPVQATRAKGRTLKLPVAQREATPERFADWLLLLAAQCERPVAAKASVTCAGRYAHLAKQPGRRNSFLNVDNLMIG